MGPVEDWCWAWAFSALFLTIKVRGHWINIQRNATKYAWKVPDNVVQEWNDNPDNGGQDLIDGTTWRMTGQGPDSDKGAMATHTFVQPL